jgi:hypothetical protein
MELQYIRDNQVIERYLQGKLSAADEEAFEEAYMTDPELLGEVQLAERLREGLNGLPAEQRAAPAKPRSRWLELAGSPRYGIAASLVAAAALVTSGALYFEQQGIGAGGVSFAGASSPRIVPLLSVRGSANPNTIVAPGANELTVLLVDAGLGDYDSYRAVLTRPGASDELVRLDGLTPAYEGMVAIALPDRALAAGNYEIRLEGAKAGGQFDELSRTPLTVTARP